MKNYSFFKYYVGGAAARVGYVLHTIGSWVTEHISFAYHHVRGSDVTHLRMTAVRRRSAAST